MTPAEYIRAGVELVGWNYDDNTLTKRAFIELPQTEREIELGVYPIWLETTNPVAQAALAAALKREVNDKTITYAVIEWPERTDVMQDGATIATRGGDDFSMNAIMAVVDSGILK